MQNIAQEAGVFNTPNENGTKVKPLFHLTTAKRAGLPFHTVTTRAREFAYELFSQALEVDNEPDFGVTRGVFCVQFFADAAECATAIEAAQTSAEAYRKAGCA